jgi:hypothetical protein
MALIVLKVILMSASLNILAICFVACPNCMNMFLLFCWWVFFSVNLVGFNVAFVNFCFMDLFIRH